MASPDIGGFRRVLLGAAAAIALAVGAAPREASAQAAVACVNCSTVYQQLIDYAQRAKAYGTQLAQYARQGQQLAYQVQNTISLPFHVWAQLENDVQMVQNLLQQGEHLSLNSRFAVSQLGSYAGQVSSVIHMPERYEAWSKHANSNIASIMKALGQQQNQFTTSQQTLRQAQANVMSSQGAVQAAQAHAAITSQGVAQMQMMHQALLAQAQMIANQQALNQQQQATTQALLTQFTGTPVPSMTGGQRY